MRFLIFIATMIFLIPPFAVDAGKWSSYTTIETKQCVEVSYRYLEQKNSWVVGYKCSNTSKDWAEPVLVSRAYSCSDGKEQVVDKSKKIGPLPPGENRALVRDAGICAGAEVSSVNVSVEIQEVSENVKKMWE